MPILLFAFVSSISWPPILAEAKSTHGAELPAPSFAAPFGFGLDSPGEGAFPHSNNLLP
jgi:hypothetical protein